jgi:DNA-directed RNA polymerase specialized sigma24 family protein
VVRLRFFAGLSVEQIAETIAISPRTVNREWTFARAWLHGALKRIARPTLETENARIHRLFDEAAELPPEQRAEFLDRECGGDTALREGRRGAC